TTSPQLPVDEDEHQRRRLSQLLAWDICVCALGVLCLMVVYLEYRYQDLPLLAAEIVLNAALLVWARTQVRRHNVTLAIGAVCTSLWVIIPTVAYLFPQSLALTVMLAIWPVALALPYVAGRTLKGVMLISAAVVVLVVGLSLRPNPEGTRLPGD